MVDEKVKLTTEEKSESMFGLKVGMQTHLMPFTKILLKCNYNLNQARPYIEEG
jgi:predicted transcriptional regulator